MSDHRGGQFAGGVYGLGFIGALVYGGAILGLFGKAWLASLWRAPSEITPASVPPEPE